MNQTIKEAWMRELRGKKYKQGWNFALRVSARRFGMFPEFRYCPIGVLCDLYVRSPYFNFRWVSDGYKKWSPVRHGVRSDEEYWFYPPPEIIAWAGISDSLMEFLCAADEAELSFKQVAKMLDKLY